MTLTFPAIHTSFTTIGLIEFPVQFAAFLMAARLLYNSQRVFDRSLWLTLVILTSVNLLVYEVIEKEHLGRSGSEGLIALLFIAWYVAPAVHLRTRNFAFDRVTPGNPSYAVWWVLYSATYAEFAMYVLAQSVHGLGQCAVVAALAVMTFAYLILRLVFSPPKSKQKTKGASVS